ncbi:hypothetical protein F8388_014929 [Cannabis sativa]|uniref:Histone deacetylase interacting domain-containing protein n=1 Tax=Cannabis sativa TaxID=3483 RepID=A0A7J6F687_CANSA|nr:hypothetical protein F8388_014929 [Cannabis sativa]KAF4404954.1 hypothetical protein G4B88_006340 [Cannabis sativa]
MKRSIDEVYNMDSHELEEPPSMDCSLEFVRVLKDVLIPNKMDKYNAFMNAMKEFKNQRLDYETLIKKITNLFIEDHQHLISGFNTFLPKQYRITVDHEKDEDEEEENDEEDANNIDALEEAEIFVNKIKTRFQGENDDYMYRSFLLILAKCKDVNKPPISQVHKEVEILFKDYPDLLVEFTNFLPIEVQKHNNNNNNYKLDLNKCVNCTPSYRLIPMNYPTPCVSQRTKLGGEVLNDHCVLFSSSVSDQEYQSSKHGSKNKYRDILFKCEDDMFELDMLLESVKSTIERAEKLMESMNNKLVRGCIENHFTPMNLRCIEMLYGDYGLDILDQLRKNTCRVLPVILNRLYQKRQEHEASRSSFNKIWANVFAENHHKSLLHRTKQQDTDAEIEESERS